MEGPHHTGVLVPQSVLSHAFVPFHTQQPLRTVTDEGTHFPNKLFLTNSSKEEKEEKTIHFGPLGYKDENTRRPGSREGMGLLQSC